MTCAEPLAGATRPGDTRKTVTVVFCDVVGSTPMAEELDPEAVRRVMTQFFEMMRAVLERHGGTVEKYIGDAVMAVFGVPTSHEDDALRAVRAVVDMREALGTLNDELQRTVGVSITTRTGVNTGEASVGDVGAGPAVLGDMVNVAARLQQAAAPGQILLGRDTFALVRGSVAVDGAGSLVLKGKRLPVTAYRLIELTRSITDAVPRPAPALVGRAGELRLLQEAFEQARDERSCRLLTVVGSAGSGKSRLASEFTRGLAGDAVVVVGRCLPYGEGITFWPVAEVVKQLASIDNDDDADAVRAKLTGLLRGADDAALLFTRVAAATGLADVTAGMQETFWSIRRLLEWVGRDRPVVVVFDDLQWAEPTFLDLLDYLVRSCRDVAILLLCLARIDLLEERPAWASQSPSATTLHLGPLAETETAELIRELLEGAELGIEMRGRIGEVAGGNPLFIEEMLQMLRDDGLLERGDPGSAPSAVEAPTLAVPPTIHALVGARLDRLDPQERSVIRAASVIGKQFWWGAVLELMPEDLRPNVGAVLQSLVRRELIAPDRSAFVGEDAFRFHHLLIQESVYRETPKDVRADLHRRFATWLERTTGDRMGEYEEILAYHLERAARYLTELGRLGEETDKLIDAASRTLGSAGRRAIAHGDVSAAANLLGRAHDVLAEGDLRRLELMPELGLALTETGDLGRADELLDAAIAWAMEVGNRGLESNARVVRVLLQESIDPEHRSEEAAGVLDRAIPVLEELEDDLGLARAWRLLADVHWTLGAYAEADRALERALVHARKAGAVWEEAESLRQYAGSGLYGPATVPEVVARCERIIAESKGSRMAESGALRSLGALRAMEGRFDEGRELVRRSEAILEDLGLKLRAAFTSEAAGFIEQLAGDHASAERVLREGYERLEELGERGFLSTVAAALAHPLCAQGRFEDAEAFIRIAREVGADDDVATQVLWRSAQAKVLVARGALEEAAALARDAVTLAERTDDINMRGDALMDLGAVFNRSGSPEDAHDAVRRAHELYLAKGNLVSAERAERLLEDASTGEAP